mmetsp:Transcript_27268/g.86643  ORF Transcript_27268/g.86643 Transcript_27268/m.86643 type:complete len:316 (+) Transcript_27268:82-1029(+)
MEKPGRLGRPAHVSAEAPSHTGLAWLWWGSLVGLAAVNAALFARAAGRAEPEGPEAARRYQRRMKWLAAPYAFQAVWRSVFPSEYPFRLAFFDTPLSSAMLARCMAAVGEVCFGAQLALATAWVTSDVEQGLKEEAAETGSDGAGPLTRLALQGVRAGAAMQLLFDVAGQVCACAGTITTNQLFFVWEAVLWSLFSAVGALNGCFLWHTCRSLGGRRRGSGQPFVVGLGVAGTAMCAYMCSSYLPACYSRWELDIAQQRLHPTFLEGLADALLRRVPTREWSAWKHDAGWLSGYFSFGIWSSLWMMRAPRLEQLM